MIEIKFDDPWLSFPKKVSNEIGAVTPKIVKESIEFANLNLEWTEKPNSLIKLENGNFSIVN